MDVYKKPTRFSLIRHAKNLNFATRGVWVFLRTTYSAWIEITLILIAVALGIFFHITYIDWMLLTFAAGSVLTAEAFNTAIEIDIDLTSPEYHPYARDTKDVAAGAVLISSIMAAIIGLGIFGHYFVEFAGRFL